MGERVLSRSFLLGNYNPEACFLCLGMTCFFAWVGMLFCFEGLLRDYVAYGGGVIHDPFFLGATASASLHLLFFRAVSSSRVCIASLFGAAGAFAGVLLSWLVAQEDALLRLSAMLLGIIVGYCIAKLTLAWGMVVSSLDMRKMLIPLCLAFCLQWLPLVPIASLGIVSKAAISLVLPLLSALCLALLRGQWGRFSSEGTDAPCKRGAAEPKGETVFAMRRISLALFCFAAVFQFVWTFNIVAVGQPLDSRAFWCVFACVLAITALVMAGALMLMNRMRTYRMELLYRAAFIFGATGACSLGLAISYPFLSYAIAYIAYALIVPTAWMLVWCVVFMGRISPQRAIGVVFGLQYLAFFFGFIAAKACGLLGLFPLQGVALIATVVVCVVYSLVLPERTLLSLSPRLFGLSHDSIEARCRDLAEHRGLTERETEVLSFLARGRDVSWIERKLFISRNTVNTHRKNLYRKLGVHTQQELLSLIEESME